MWELLTERRGIEVRDAVWSHPDLLPDLDDPDSWLGPVEQAVGDPAVDWDAGLRALDKDLDGELDEDAQSPYGLDGEPGPEAPPDQT
jgi:hypothetical protein